MLAVCCCLMSGTVLAASPRDAVKTLPRVSHTSDFHTTESDRVNSHTYDDVYNDTWDINWQPQPVRLPVGLIGVELHYQKTLSDHLYRHQGTSGDSRRDQYDFTARLEQAGSLSSRFTITEEDIRNGSYPSDSPPSFSARTTKQAYLAWSPPNLPSISAIHSVTNTATYLGSTLSQSSESQWTQYKLDYSSNSARVNQSIDYTGEQSRSYTFYPARTGTSTSKQVWDAARVMPLGNIGNLAFGARLQEDTSRQDSEADATRQTTSQYSLGLDGNVASLPLDYHMDYLSTTQSLNGNWQNDHTQERFGLGFRPPVPEGKSAGISYSAAYDEYTNANNSTGVNSQQITWQFAPNKLVSNRITYARNTTIDRLAEAGTNENEQVLGTMSYSIPGGRGTFTGTLTQNIQRQPDDDSRAIYSTLDFNTFFKLGNRANLTLFYTQSYNDNRTSYLATPSTTDALNSGVNYYINAGNGISLNARWHQYYRLELPSETKTANQGIDLTFNYQTAANWNYALRVTSNDESKTPGGATGTTYRTGDEVQALITYSF
jgi:hypothetical protein